MPVTGAWGVGFSLLTESFAVRALLGSLAAAGLAALAARAGLVRGRRARRLLVLTPALTAAVACVAVALAREAYLPQLWITTAAGATAGQVLELLGEWRVKRDLDVVVVAYVLVVAVLSARRALGTVAVRRLLRRASPATDTRLLHVTERLAAAFGVRTPTLLLLPACPGGAFTTTRTWRPVVALDPRLVDELDERELEALVAHELAHVARHDPLVVLLVGVVRDLSFFVPPVHLAARWLAHEQEESADELASLHTGRPAALASSILKVFDVARAGRPLRVACGAVGGVVLVGDGLKRRPGGRRRTRSTQVVTTRVERLIDGQPGTSVWRRTGEVLLALAVLAAAASAALLVPGWLASDYDADELSFTYLAAPPQVPVESPAFATFRALAPERRSRAGTPVSDGVTTPLVAARDPQACPCVESQAQLHAGSAATAPATSTRMLWRSADYDLWEVSDPADEARVRAARPLWTLSDSGPQVGFFVLSGTS
jgi:Zn-dependent protease with chaperone function